MVWRAEDPQGNEAAKVKWEIVPYTRGAGLDLGCGPHKAFPHFLGVDNCVDTQLFGIEMQPDMVVDDCSVLADFEDGQCDFVFSSHLLEHIVDYRAALKEWWRVLRVGGYLVLYLPHRNLYPNVGTPGANPDHKHDFVPLDIIEAVRELGSWDLVERQVRDQGMEYSFLLVFEKRADGAPVTYSHLDRKPKKTACVVRYGGFGDMLQACNILPALKRAGYHVTVMTTPKGRNVIEHDPHVDAWFIQDDDQVPNHQLHEFWAYWETRFDKFVQLSESVEGTLLAMPGRANHAWPDAMRRRLLNHNYLEFTSQLAELPYASEARFYPTVEEAQWAQSLLGEGPNVMFALAGSSIHKFYPGQDVVIGEILRKIPNAKVFLCGDMACKILEAGWEDTLDVVCLSGEIGIRETLALAQQCDVVIGPETGVLNAVAFEPKVRKVCLLSHSSVENLTKHWINAEALTPPSALKCYPCHRLHYGREFCFEHPESGASMCAASIHPQDVFFAAFPKRIELA